jgi:hypothetical protein
MQTQQCNGQAVFLIWINVPLKFCLQRFLGPLGVYFSVHVAPHSDRLAQGAAKAKTIDRLDELRHSRRQQKMGETSMGIPLEHKTPGRSAAEGTSSELLKLVHKLRWAGMEEEAERLLKKLKHEQTPPEDSVVATPTETD